MQFADYVADYALQINTQSLVTLRGDGPLSPREVHGLRINVKRLRAAWAVIDPIVDAEVSASALARLGTVHRKLGVQRDRDVILTTLRKLIARAASDETGSKKLERALTRLAEAIPASSSRLIDIETVGIGFEDESRAWRELETAAKSVHETVKGGFGRTYRNGRAYAALAQSGRIGAKKLHRWRGVAKNGLYQLEIVRPVLGRSELTRHWYMERFAAALGRHQDLHMLRPLMVTAGLNRQDKARIGDLIADRQKAFEDRAMKLFPRIYGQSVKKYVRSLEHDVAGLAVENLVFLPRRIG